jgi:uncharacterized NAD(P)/FAD-binding protein YdhS
MQPRSATVAIIGGGFSGTVLAANLLRRPPASPCAGPARIVLVERRAQIGCGVAYAPSSYPFLLNVPAGRMSAASYAPMQLVEFARRYDSAAGSDSYLSRQLYGEYLQEFLRAAEQAAPEKVELERVHGEATVVRSTRGPGPLLVHVGAQQYLADQVVLACGDPPPAEKPYATEVEGLPAYVRDPHQPRALNPSDRTLLLIGTGLTMVDMAVAAVASNPSLQIIALSRHGLLPAVQHSPSPAGLAAQLDLCGLLACRSLRHMVAAVRALALGLHANGGDWREAITRARECVPRLWHSLSEADRQRFLRHVRVYWDTHRHRMPPQFAEHITAMLASGQLQVRAGCIRQLRTQDGTIAVRWRARGCGDSREFSVDRVIDCSGSAHRLQRTSDRLWRQLLDAGLALPDTGGLGVRTAQHGALIDAAGRASSQLFYLGPMLRADYWEATAVGELRTRAEALAAALADEAMRPRSAAVAH